MSRINNFLDWLAWWLSAVLLAVLPFHAFLFTWFKAFFWSDAWTIFVQSWKEILVGTLGTLALAKLISTRKFPRERSFWLGVIFVILASLYAIFGSGLLAQKLLGLRTATLFIVVFLAVQFFDFDAGKIAWLRRIVLTASGAVILFALAQKFLLPADFLKNFGYSENVSSWLPGGNLPMFHLVGESTTIRLQSTFAGPNQLAAFLLVILPLIGVQFSRAKNWKKYFCLAEFVAGILVLIFSFSRSAWLGAAAIFLIFAVTAWRQNLPEKLKYKLLWGGVISAVTLAVLIFSSGNFLAIVTREASTSEHFEKSLAAAELVAANPLGLGLGKTAGVAQRFEANPITPENTYLGITLELGWLGGILFLIFCGTLLFELRKKHSPLFYSLAGILVVALLLHPLEDAPTALTLFLLLGLDKH
ncbi:MAG: O-antigen ligase family protein [Patescibacteria group bacterium]|jgi:hypothetical protein